MSKYLKRFWPFFIFLLIYFGIFYKLFIGLFPFPGDLLVSWFFPYSSGGWIGYSSWITHREFIAADVVRQLFPWRDLAIEMLRNGQIPLWNPYAFSGSPLLANLQSAVFYPLNILFFLFNSKTAWITYVLSQPILAFIFMYIFIRSISLSKHAALFCGLAFGFIGYMAVWLEWGVVGHSALWLPLILYGITNYFKNNSHRHLALSSLALAFSVFAGHAQTTTYVALTAFLYYLFYVISLRKNIGKSFKALISGAWFILLALGISAIQILPSLELLQLSARDTPQSLVIFHNFQLPFFRLLTIFVPDFFGNPAVGNAWQGNYAEFLAYFGIVALIFAVVGVFYQKQNKFVRFFLLLSFVSLIFALPTFFSEALAEFHVPVLGTSSPARILFILQFSFVILAGFGIDTYLLKKVPVWKSLSFLVFIYIAIWAFIAIAPFLPQAAPVIPFLDIVRRNLFLPTVILITVFILILIGTKNNKFKIITFFCFLVLAGFEYQYAMYKFSPFSPLTYFFPKQTLVSYLQEESHQNRIYGYDTGRLETNLPTQWRLQSPEGYDALYIKRYGELISAGYSRDLTRSDALFENSMPNEDSYAKQMLLNLTDVRYITYKDSLAPKVWSPQEWKFPKDRFKLIYQIYKWKVYENINAIPKASVFYDYVVKANDEKIIKTLFDKNFPYRNRLILEEAPLNISTNKDIPITPAKVILYQPNKIAIEALAEKNGLLFLADNYYPGWSATVDDMPTKIYRADYTFRAIPVTAGKHIVILEYWPKSFVYGAIISGISLLLTVLLLLKSSEKKIKKE